MEAPPAISREARRTLVDFRQQIDRLFARMLGPEDQQVTVVSTPLRGEGPFEQAVRNAQEAMDGLLALDPDPKPTHFSGLGTAPLSPAEKLVQARMEPDKHGEKGRPSRHLCFHSFSRSEQRTLDALWKVAEEHRVLVEQVEGLAREQGWGRASIAGTAIGYLGAALGMAHWGLPEPGGVAKAVEDLQALQKQLEEVTQERDGLAARLKPELLCSTVVPYPAVGLGVCRMVVTDEESAAAIRAVVERMHRAERALRMSGWTDCGGKEWKPPVGPSASPVLDRLDALRSEHEATLALVERQREEMREVEHHLVRAGASHALTLAGKAEDVANRFARALKHHGGSAIALKRKVDAQRAELNRLYAKWHPMKEARVVLDRLGLDYAYTITGIRTSAPPEPKFECSGNIPRDYSAFIASLSAWGRDGWANAMARKADVDEAAEKERERCARILAGVGVFTRSILNPRQGVPLGEAGILRLLSATVAPSPVPHA